MSMSVGYLSIAMEVYSCSGCPWELMGVYGWLWEIWISMVVWEYMGFHRYLYLLWVSDENDDASKI